MKYVLGKKIGMVQLFDVTGKIWPATIVYCEPNKIIEVKKNSIKVGFDSIDAKKLNKAQLGIFKKIKSDLSYSQIHEFANVTGFKVNDELKVNQFKAGEYVDVQGTTKGHGFSGAIKRWNFKIGPLSHGAGYPHRYQGSIAMGRGGSQAQRVRKGQKMSGHYGDELVTIQNLQILYVNERDNTITIYGAVPGHKNGTVLIKNSIKNKKAAKPIEIITKANIDEIQEKAKVLLNKEEVKKQNIEIDKKEKEIAEQQKKIKEVANVAKKEEQKVVNSKGGK